MNKITEDTMAEDLVNAIWEAAQKTPSWDEPKMKMWLTGIVKGDFRVIKRIGANENKTRRAWIS